MNPARFHGAFAPNSQHRALVTPARRGKGSQAKDSKKRNHSSSVDDLHPKGIKAQRVKRVFHVDTNVP